MSPGVALTQDLRGVLIYMHSSSFLDAKTISRLSGIPLRTIQRILSHWRKTGETKPIPAGKRGRPRALNFSDTQFLLATVTRRNDLYLDELRDGLEERCGVTVSESTVWRTLQRAGFRLKEGEKYTPEQLVFVDESACDRHTYLRNRAWALEGLRACRKQVFTRGKRYSILPAITMGGIIECLIIEGSFNSELFISFISDLLEKMNPFPAPNSVVVMENCSIHKHPRVREMIEQKGMRIEYLPAYSPDFNPIELAFSLLKHKLRRTPPPAGTDFAVREYLYYQTFGIKASDCKAFYKKSGYL